MKKIQYDLIRGRWKVEELKREKRGACDKVEEQEQDIEDYHV